MIPEGLLLDLALALLTAFVAGGVMVLLKQPVILGYLLAGLAVGPFALRLVSNVEVVKLLAEIGVAFLMFTLGVELSREELRRVRKIALFGGALQILLTIGFGAALGLMLGWKPYEAVFFGALISLSSTMVVLKLFMDRGEIETLPARIALGILIVQDLGVVPMMVVLPALAGDPASLAGELALAALKAIGLLVATLVFGARVVPRLLFWVASTRSRELFILAVVAICLGTAFATYFLGLSVALGAFIAGVVVSRSVFKYQIVAEVRPLRDIFAVVFFVSVGMLINPSFIVNNAAPVLLTALAIVVGKLLIVFSLAVAFGYSGRVATLSALALVQIGEFSFVLAKLGADRGLISDYLYSLTLTSALLTILVTPFVLQLAPRLVGLLEQAPTLRGFFARVGAESRQPAESMSQHVVICGHGAVGSGLARVLEQRQFKFFIIENDPQHVMELRSRGVPCVYGDAANPNVLAQANLAKARVLVVAVPDAASTDQIVQHAMQINPKLDILARVSSSQQAEVLRQYGCKSIVEPKFEAGLEMIRHTLHRFGVSTQEVLILTNRMRADHYADVVEEDLL